MTIIVQKETLKAAARFELTISCLLDRRFNQLSHAALGDEKEKHFGINSGYFFTGPGFADVMAIVQILVIVALIGQDCTITKRSH